MSECVTWGARCIVCHTLTATFNFFVFFQNQNYPLTYTRDSYNLDYCRMQRKSGLMSWWREYMHILYCILHEKNSTQIAMIQGWWVHIILATRSPGKCVRKEVPKDGTNWTVSKLGNMATWSYQAHGPICLPQKIKLSLVVLQTGPKQA